MNVSGISSRVVKTYTLTITEGEIRPVRYARQGREYRVERIEVMKHDGNINSVTLSGSVLKKDGSESQNGTTERLYGERDWPTWLPAVIKGLA